MRIRRLVSVGWAMAFVLATAVPAFAKGAHQVTLTADGQRVTFSGDGEPNTNTILSNFAGSVRLWDSLSTDGERLVKPIGDLGPEITAEWMFIGPIGDIPIVQSLYPFAEGGPVGHIPPGQMLWDEAVEEAWFPLADDLTAALASVGFDLTLLDPAAMRTDQATPAPGSAWSPLWLFGLVVVMGAGALGARSGIMRRRNQRMA
jgi:hypothetical protein